MTDDVRVWLVGREFTDKGLVTLQYATRDGERVLVQQRSATNLGEVTAALEVSADRLVPADAADRERFAAEADRMTDEHAPDDAV